MSDCESFYFGTTDEFQKKKLNQIHWTFHSLQRDSPKRWESDENLSNNSGWAPMWTVDRWYVTETKTNSIHFVEPTTETEFLWTSFTLFRFQLIVGSSVDQDCDCCSKCVEFGFSFSWMRKFKWMFSSLRHYDEEYWVSAEEFQHIWTFLLPREAKTHTRNEWIKSTWIVFVSFLLLNARSYKQKKFKLNSKQL